MVHCKIFFSCFDDIPKLPNSFPDAVARHSRARLEGDVSELGVYYIFELKFLKELLFLHMTFNVDFVSEN